MLCAHVAYLRPDGSTAEDELTRIEPFGDEQFSSQCVSGDILPQIDYDNVISAIDTRTGADVSIRELCGARMPARPIASAPDRIPRPLGPRHHGTEATKGQRQKDAREFQSRFKANIIYNHFRNRIFEGFGCRCFACGNPRSLYLDHHLPMIRGGRREAGNIVVLCHVCNTIKADRDAAAYYSESELLALRPILDAQHEALSFTFDAAAWEGDPVSVLRALGISALLIAEVESNPEHPLYFRGWDHAQKVMRAQKYERYLAHQKAKPN